MKPLWKKLEELVARDIEGYTQSGSGSKSHAKGDCINPAFLIECKSTEDEECITLKAKWFSKIVMEARQRMRMPALAFCCNREDKYIGAIRYIDVPDDIIYNLDTLNVARLKSTMKFNFKEDVGAVKVDDSVWVILNRQDFIETVKFWTEDLDEGN